MKICNLIPMIMKMNLKTIFSLINKMKLIIIMKLVNDYICLYKKVIFIQTSQFCQKQKSTRAELQPQVRVCLIGLRLFEIVNS